MAKDINKDFFTEETKLKLKIFADCFQEWFPVFLHHPSISNLFVFDFFAGSGKDPGGDFGSPLILLEKAKGLDRVYCDKAQSKNIKFSFNESKPAKLNSLKTNVGQHLSDCVASNQCGASCQYGDNISFSSRKFKDIFNSEKVLNIFSNNKVAKFVLLDQYGFSEVNEDVFVRLVDSPKTDFIFFISSSFIRRFKDRPEVTKYFDTQKISYDETEPRECHREIAKYFASLIPNNKEYYLHHFTIQKKANYYGLIFGSSHTLGMEKFLKVCWGIDRFSGESNCNINDDHEDDSLFYNPSYTCKMADVKDLVRNAILSKKIIDNQSGLKYALNHGCLPILFVDVISELVNNKKVRIIGKFNKQSTDIHKVNLYRIEVEDENHKN